ncbi:MAG: type II toxin-antitoxin system HicB family antitoxin [Candidatus Micrarchaeota archaeon]
MDKYEVQIERDEDGYYVATVPKLPGCHTQARSIDKLLERIKEAIELYLEEDNVEITAYRLIAQARKSDKYARPAPAKA